MLRKRYRPLDAVEERSVGVEQLFQIGPLYDERSYCYSWPEAPLTSMLCKSNPSLTPGMNNSISTSTQTTVAQPPIFPIDIITTEHGKENFFNLLSKTNLAISFSSGNKSGFTQNINLRPYKKISLAPPNTTTEDSIFSFNAKQIKELKSAGAFDAFYKEMDRTGWISNGKDSEKKSYDEKESIARRKMEEELIQLEWRAFQESEKTTPALQRVLLLGTSVPFIKNEKKSQEENSINTHKSWQRIVYDLWLQWRRETVVQNEEGIGDLNILPWGTQLLPGSFLTSSAKEYFLSVNTERNGNIKTGRYHERMGGDGDEQHLFSSSTPKRRGVYGFLRWRIDLYEPRLRAVSGGGRGEDGIGRSAKLLSAAEVNTLISEKLPQGLADVQVEERWDPLDVLALTDIRSEVETWRQWLSNV